MIVGIGLDLVDVERVGAALDRHGARFRTRVLAVEEDEELSKRPPGTWPMHVAGRFAAKEAALKALGTGLRGGMNWTDVVVTRGNGDGAPALEFRGVAARVARDRGVKATHLTITHTHAQAAAVVVLES